MPDRPNLDYEPGPAAASYSRLGPRPETHEPGKQAPPQAEPHHRHRYELAGELAVHPATGRARRRPSHRLYKRAH